MHQARLTNVRSCDVTGLSIVTKGPSERRLRGSVFRILEEDVLCSIATVTADNRAHINTAYFSYSDQLEIYFLSHPDSLHCRNLSANPSAGMAIFSSSQVWTEPGLGVQLFGTCSPAKGAQATKAERLYGGRFPAYGRWRENLAEDDVAREYCLYRFLVERLKLHDEGAFGDGVFIHADVRPA
jgi:uncharacterized protein YhbP (UPF0306 family)